MSLNLPLRVDYLITASIHVVVFFPTCSQGTLEQVSIVCRYLTEVIIQAQFLSCGASDDLI